MNGTDQQGKKLSSVQQDNLLFEELRYVGTYDVATECELISFNQDNDGVTTVAGQDEILRCLDDGRVHWLSVRGLTDVKRINAIMEHLGVSYLWRQDILNGRHMAKVETVSDMVLVLMNRLNGGRDGTMGKEHIALLLLKDTVVSFQESHDDHFREIRAAILGRQSVAVRHSADYLLNLLMSCIVDNYMNVLDAHREQWMDIEEELIDFNGQEGFNSRIQRMRKDYLFIRRNIKPLQTQMQPLLMRQSDVLKPSNTPYFRDTNDHLMQVFQILDSLDGIIASVVDMYMATNDMRLNRIVGRLTVLSAVFIPLTFMAGIWGMNFRAMPELEWPYGYPVALLSMVAVAVSVLIYFKVKRWI